MKNKYYWSEETLEYFSTHQNEIANFVKYECDLEEGETLQMLIDDLYKQIDSIKKNNYE
jgi:molybdopterin converting factor small subunit